MAKNSTSIQGINKRVKSLESQMKNLRKITQDLQGQIKRLGRRHPLMTPEEMTEELRRASNRLAAMGTHSDKTALT